MQELVREAGAIPKLVALLDTEDHSPLEVESAASALLVLAHDNSGIAPTHPTVFPAPSRL